VRVVNATTFRGVLVPVVRWMYVYKPGFELMNDALKARAEAAELTRVARTGLKLASQQR